MMKWLVETKSEDATEPTEDRMASDQMTSPKGDEAIAVDQDIDITRYLRGREALKSVERTLLVQPEAATALIAILDEESLILAVNRTWRAFAEANGAKSGVQIGLGARYLQVCDGAKGECALEAGQFAAGLRAVIRGERDRFELVSACHSPLEKRWYLGRVTRCQDTVFPMVAVVHLDVTERYLPATAL